MVSSQKVESEVNNDIYSKASVSQADITKVNVDTKENAVNEILGGEGGINGPVHEAA